MEPSAAPRLFMAPPSRFPELLLQPKIGSLVLGDAALAAPLALDAIALFAAQRVIGRVQFCGRAGGHYRDRLLELIDLQRATPPPARHLESFDPIDFELAAEAVASAASPTDLNAAVLDASAPLEAAMISALNAETSVAPLPPLKR